MAVMTCPRCGGSGAILEGAFNTTIVPSKSICPSCSGSGYVSDTPSTLTSVVVNIDSLKLEQPIEDHYLKCPECGKAIKIQLGHYLALPDTAKKI